MGSVLQLLIVLVIGVSFVLAMGAWQEARAQSKVRPHITHSAEGKP